MKRVAVIFSIFLMITVSGYGEINDAGNYLNQNVVIKKLKNGITLVMLNRGYAPILSFDVAFKVGAVDESYSSIGMAHMLEHMLFKGTDKIGTTDFKKEKVILDKIEAVGETIDKIKIKNPKNMLLPKLAAQLKKLQKEHRKYVVNAPYDMIYTSNGAVGFNASTSNDKTGYYVSLPSSKLELWAKLESERLRNPILREFYLERNNVFQERLMRTDSSGKGMLFEKFLATAFIAHPYRHPVIGWSSCIKTFSIKDLRKFYRKHYIPSKTVITIVGKQDPEKTYKIIAKYFEAIPKKRSFETTKIIEPKQIGEKRISINFKSSPYMIIGWHKPTYPSKDDYVMDVISMILANGKNSRLYKRLVYKEKLASSVGSWNGVPAARYNNLFTIFIEPRSNRYIPKIEKIVYEEIERLLKDVSKSEIQRILNNVESGLVFGLGSNKGLAHTLSYYQTIFGDWHYLSNYLKEIKNVNVKDIRSAIKKYLVKTNRTVAILKNVRENVR